MAGWEISADRLMKAEFERAGLYLPSERTMLTTIAALAAGVWDRHLVIMRRFLLLPLRSLNALYQGIICGSREW